MARYLLAVTLVAIAVLPAASQTSSPSASGIELGSLDRTADPCVNFHQFACGGWMAGHPLPSDQAELRALTPGFDWTKYFAAVSAPRFTTINVRQPAYVKAVNRLIAEAPMADLQVYFRWHLVHSSALMLPAAVRQTDFEFFGRALRGQQVPLPRWRACVSETDERLGDALGKAFVEETFPPRAKTDTLAMAAAIKAAMKQEIGEAGWMSDATKKAALLKLDAVIDRIGYPDRWRD